MTFCFSTTVLSRIPVGCRDKHGQKSTLEVRAHAKGRNSNPYIIKSSHVQFSEQRCPREWRGAHTERDQVDYCSGYRASSSSIKRRTNNACCADCRFCDLSFFN